ncbi:8921_t:CDS:2 [Acaulospora morrowiae]|uniref:8921_t:CDS:1 n=1 Tax=Acaulospora morrowiae TaxID=94023 RepID=A0A9N8ZYT8_9GLOM|nr:8921_t:CDS:2 [Acaulospora morrowiae]
MKVRNSVVVLTNGELELIRRGNILALSRVRPTGQEEELEKTEGKIDKINTPES